MKTVINQFRLQSRLFCNATEGVGNQESLASPGESINHMRWMAGHLVTIRYGFAEMLGLKGYEWPHRDLFVDVNKTTMPNTRAQDGALNYPTLEESARYWNELAKPFTDALAQLSAEQWNKEVPFSGPIDGNTLAVLLGFIAHHEAYHIGQLALLRKLLGHEAMSYGPRTQATVNS